MENLRGINITIEICCSILCLCFVFAILVADSSKTKMNRAFVWVLLSNIAVMMSDTLAFYSIGRPGGFFRVANYVGNFFCFIFSYVVIVAFSYYVTLFFSSRGKISNAPFYFVLASQGLAILLTVLALFNDMYFIIDEHNIYHRQGWYWLSQMLGMAGMLANSLLILRYRKRLDRLELFAFTFYIVVPVIAILVQTLVYGLVTVYIASTLSIIIIYLSIQAQQNRIVKERELELTQSKISVMLSQIQPHFLYNVLASINELYDGNPKAQQAVVTFAEYLRTNMDSLGENRMIPFSKELQHVQQYLWLEEMRFEERLQVAFDIQADDFLLPALTVQPIVENAVRHGLFHKKNGGKVTIATCETPNGHRITVVDDGVGFVPETGKADDRSHIGIENVRGRLDAMCGGVLSIESAPGRGTVATILIPKQKGGPA